MKKKKNQWCGPVIIAAVILAIVGLVRHFHIKNFNVVRPEALYTSGQPRGMDYARLLYKYHIGTIVNIRSAAEHREKNWYNEEITWVRNNGVRYKELPIDRSLNRADYFPDERTQEDFLSLMADKKSLPVLLHGSSGRKRVSMLAAVWLVRSQGCNLEDTIRTVERIKTGPVTEAEKKFIEGLAKNK